MSRKRRVDWTFFGSNDKSIFCTRCQVRQAVTLPVFISDLAKIVDAFNLLHAGCKENPSKPGESTCPPTQS